MKYFAITVLINLIVTCLLYTVMVFSSQWSQTAIENYGLERSIVQPPTADISFKVSSLSHSMVPIIASSAGLSILKYMQQDATLHSLFYLETALHVSGDTIAHHQERKQLYLQHLVFVTQLLLSAAIVEELETV